MFKNSAVSAELKLQNNTEAEKFKLDDFFRDIRTILDLQSQKYDGRLDLSCPNNLYVEFNKTALEQIALNLSRNGFEAMRHLPKTKKDSYHQSKDLRALTQEPNSD